MKKIGRYEIVGELGRGAMGVVYKASDPTIGRLVAIKVLSLPPSSEDGLPGAREIFLREARAAGRLSHPGIVTIHDALEDPETQNSYIVMEFVPGRTLEQVLLAGPALSTERALDIARQLAEALDYAHSHKIIHRDLKPANILLTEGGRSKITDFGIAKVAAGEGAQRTMAIMGTPAYMSPEQVTGGEVGTSSDLFSLGILLYLMLTGEKPFTGDTAAVMFKIAYQDPAPPSQYKPELGPDHDYLLLRSLAKDREKRYATARQFLDDLEDVQHGRPPRSESRVPMSELRAGERTLIASRPAIPSPEVATAIALKKTRRVWAGIGAAAVAVLLVAGVLALRHRRTSPPAPAVPSQATSAPAPAPPAAPTAVPTAGPSSTPTPAKRGKIPTTATPGKVERAPKPAETTAQEAPAPAPPAPSAAGTTVLLSCRYEFEEATLTVTADGRPILREILKGRKKGRLLGLKRGYTGTFSQPIKIPSGAHQLTVHAVSEGGSVNLSRSIAATVPAGNSATLRVVVNRERMSVSW